MKVTPEGKSQKHWEDPERRYPSLQVQNTQALLALLILRPSPRKARAESTAPLSWWLRQPHKAKSAITVTCLSHRTNHSGAGTERLPGLQESLSCFLHDSRMRWDDVRADPEELRVTCRDWKILPHNSVGDLGKLLTPFKDQSVPLCESNGDKRLPHYYGEFHHITTPAPGWAVQQMV